MWWKQHSRRYRKEIGDLRRHHPQAKIVAGPHLSRYCPTCKGVINPAEQHLAVLATISTRLGRSYPIIMVYPCDFPYRVPGVWSLQPLRPRPPHIFADDRLCLTVDESAVDVTGSVVLTWAFDYFTCYDIWCKSGTFPSTNYGKHRV